ncbi:cystatin-A5-like [Tachysurus fulvidraco]|uniref:cystatin-A5-like n=1 Tax=Tachysurus fulvidraco TaxID=1234273 RepID=UPI001FED8F23|nr:cystatin-A5-like [Tachysurus fulvidraco]
MSSELFAQWSDWKDPDEHDIIIANEVKIAAEAIVRSQFFTYKPLVYKEGTNVGTKYIIKVYVGNNQIVNLIVTPSLKVFAPQGKCHTKAICFTSTRITVIRPPLRDER